ncbi:MAG: hypF [Anaerosporomusa subterranea]|nr:hypF [Anaerosporomusa subterranea]
MRLAIRITGIVQGVGFRPFVYQLSHRLGLSGWVKNNGGGVSLEVEGTDAALAVFQRALTQEAPKPAVVEQVMVQQIEPVGETGFFIAKSDTSARPTTLLSPDLATCEACCRELFNPADRRYRYPFINCTECGPRYTIVRGLPYDRPATTMAGFLLCPACRREYEDPINRRFHAQPNACPVCGPRCHLLDASGNEIQTDDVISRTSQLIAAGAIVALKGLGGWQLVCNARNQLAVELLRRRKGRESKPFAVMAGSLGAVRQICHVSSAEAAWLAGRERPIVLLEKKQYYDLAASVAPQNSRLGVMLPYAPLYWLLLQADDVWVMTSGNRSDEPIVYDDTDALGQLADVADYFLSHNRPIERRADDSVIRLFRDQPLFIRRSRGFSPAPVSLPHLTDSILAVGGDLKSAFCLTREGQGFISPHIGDLANQAAFTFFGQLLEQYQTLFSVRPSLVAHDLHPGYWSSRYALNCGLPTVGVQHHHAHIAAVMAEHDLAGPVIGVALDGTGYGEDGAVWGGEFLVGDLTGFSREAHFAYLPLPGGEQAVREPWRLAAWLVREIGGDQVGTSHHHFTSLLPEWWQTVAAMPANGLNSPLTSSAGRLFDAAAALIGGRLYNQYEGQAASELEYLAGTMPGTVLSYLLREGPPLTVDFMPTYAALLDWLPKQSPAVLAAAFHETMADAICRVVNRLAEVTGIRVVVLGGGVWQNARLLATTVTRLGLEGFSIYIPRQVPISDGGLCLGQAAIAAHSVDKGPSALFADPPHC